MLSRHAHDPARRNARRPAHRHALTVAGGLLVSAALGTALAAPAHAATDPFAALRQCESSGNYTTDTGNGYYGAYQFSLATWEWLGYSGLPSDAAPAVQDEAAQRLQALKGWAPWPACSSALDLTGTPAPQAVTVSTVSAPALSSTAAATEPAAHPVLSTAMESDYSAYVVAWQRQMAHLGYSIAIDGYFGPQSAGVARQFEIDHGLTVDSGIVGPQIWYAAWHVATA